MNKEIKKVRTYGTQNGTFINQNGTSYQFDGKKWNSEKNDLDFLGWFPAIEYSKDEIAIIREILMDNRY